MMRPVDDVILRLSITSMASRKVKEAGFSTDGCFEWVLLEVAEIMDGHRYYIKGAFDSESDDDEDDDGMEITGV